MSDKKISELATVVPTGAELLEVSRLSAAVTMTRTDISAQASDNSYNTAAGNFVTAGFLVGRNVRVQGFSGNVANNIQSGRITAVAPGKLTIGGVDGDVIVDDAAGESVTITQWESKSVLAQAIADLSGGGPGGGGAPTGIKLTSDTGSTADSDPGAGLFKWNNATQASATAIFADDDTVDTAALAALWTRLDITGAGTLWIVQDDDPTRWQFWYFAGFTDATGYAKFESLTLLAISDNPIEDAKDCTLFPTVIGGGGTSTAGKQDLWIPAAAMLPNVDAGPPVGAGSFYQVVPGSRVNVGYIPFDQTTSEAVQFCIRMPKKWNEGTITVSLVWTAASGTAGHGVRWRVRAVAFGDDDALSTAFGTAQGVTDSYINTYDLHVTDETAAITIANSPATRDYIVIEIDRDAGDGSDTLAADALLLGATVHLTTDAENDA